MTYPTLEEIDQIAIECKVIRESGSISGNEPFLSMELQAFFLFGIEIGRKMQRESDASICKKSDRYRGDYFANLIRNNTGE